MNEKNSFFYRLIIRVISPVIIVLFITEIYNYYNTRQVLKRETKAKNEIITDEIKAMQEFQDMALEILEQNLDKRLQELSNKLVNIYLRDTEDIEREDLNSIRLLLGMNPKYEDIYIINSEGIVVNTTFKKDLMLDLFSFGQQHREYLISILNGNKFVSEEFTIESSTKRPRKYSYQPTRDNEYIVEIGLYSDKADQLINFISQELKNIAKKVDRIREINLYVNADTPFSLAKGSPADESRLALLDDIFKRKVSYTKIEDPGNPDIIHEFMYVKKEDSDLYRGAVIEIISDESLGNAIIRRELFKSIILGIIISIIVLYIVIVMINQDIARPLSKLRDMFSRLEIGDLNLRNKLDIRLNNEIGDIILSANKIVDNLNSVMVFTKKLSKGEWETTYEMISKVDDLGHSLFLMQKNLIMVQEQEKKRKIRDEQHHWATEGIAKFSEILRENQNDILVLGNNIIKKLVTYTGAEVGAIFILNDDDRNDIHLEMVSSYAYEKYRHAKVRIEMGEGLAGMCALEKHMIYRTEIPHDYINIESGLGESRPESLLLVPLKLHEEIYGVIELASLSKFEQYKIDFIETIAENITYTVSSVKISTRTNKLLEISRKQAEEFAAKEQELTGEIENLRKEIEASEKKKEEMQQFINSLNNELAEVRKKLHRLSRKATF